MIFILEALSLAAMAAIVALLWKIVIEAYKN